ncbi:hypothetical protein AOX55_00005827 (plasmid) [Sinorhizobium fredii CCBAU 25509]|nr:hypothetical protein AOX55_00005827 [Sinorhizobium fredii CCBAU 25509]
MTFAGHVSLPSDIDTSVMRLESRTHLPPLQSAGVIASGVNGFK